MAHGLDDVAGAGLALGADHGRALADPAQRLAEVGRAAHERDLEAPLVDVVGLVGGRQHLGLVDVVDLERLEHLRLGEVADPGLGHDGDRHGLLDALDQDRIGHPRDAAVAADVGGNALERHHRGRTGVLGDLRLLGVDDVHDDAALQHLGQTGLHTERRFVSHTPSMLAVAMYDPAMSAAILTSSAPTSRVHPRSHARPAEDRPRRAALHARRLRARPAADPPDHPRAAASCPTRRRSARSTSTPASAARGAARRLRLGPGSGTLQPRLTGSSTVSRSSSWRTSAAPRAARSASECVI